METNREIKKTIRKEMLKRRRECPPDVRHSFSERIAEKVFSHPWYLQAESIYCYVDFGGEVETKNIIDTALKTGKQVFLPKVFGAKMEFFSITSLDELETGSFGILEPTAAEPVVSAKGQSLMLIPGVAFDSCRNRIGYGKGYYDRYLNEHSQVWTIALAFECQMTDRIPEEETDIRPAFIITESRII